MSYERIDKLSLKALQDLQKNHEFTELGNGDVVFHNVRVSFQSATNIVSTNTDMRVSRTTNEFGKITFDERPQNSFDTDNIHVDFDANWSNTQYEYNNTAFKVKGNSPRFGQYTVDVQL